jgi:hypothetical protein
MVSQGYQQWRRVWCRGATRELLVGRPDLADAVRTQVLRGHGSAGKPTGCTVTTTSLLVMNSESVTVNRSV